MLQIQDSQNHERDPLDLRIDGNAVDHVLQNTIAFAHLMTCYRCAMMEIETKFKVLNEEFSLRFDRQPISNIKTRLKSPLSIQEKMAKKGLPFSLEAMEKSLNDIAGIRVVCSFAEDVYMLAEALISQDDITLVERKDYIAHPKANGYRSLHLIVQVPIFLEHEKRLMKAEIQLRTIAMDSWASLEHQLRYKKEIAFDENMAAEMRKCADLSAELDSKMSELKGLVEDNPQYNSNRIETGFQQMQNRIKESLSRSAGHGITATDEE